MLMLPRSLLGWAALLIVGYLIWKNSAAAGNWVFHTLPDHISAFFSAA
jgi:hypothetical protein